MGRRKKKDFEIMFYEKLVSEKPGFVQALSCLGDAYTRRGFYREGLKVDRRLVRLKPDDPIARYNLSCSLSLLGETQEALRELKRAVLLGYDDFIHILKDRDLENVRKHPLFKDFFERIKKIGKIRPLVSKEESGERA